jgi:hypothetical protein
VSARRFLESVAVIDGLAMMASLKEAKNASADFGLFAAAEVVAFAGAASPDLVEKYFPPGVV